MMPGLAASLAAMAAGWIIEWTVEPMFGWNAALILSFAGSVIVFFVARKWLNDLRDGWL